MVRCETMHASAFFGVVLLFVFSWLFWGGAGVEMGRAFSPGWCLGFLTRHSLFCLSLSTFFFYFFS